MLGRVARLSRLVLVLVLAGVDTAPLTAENARWNVNLEERHVPEAYRGGWTNHSYFPSPEDWRSLSIYQLITDRFADGDPSNNELRYGGFDVRDMTFRHGGDFRGLTEKLQYIKGLGCRGIWISPVFQNGYNSYHQYSQLDFTLLDQRLGTKEELRRLTEQAHALGLYVIVDVVMNHMSNEFFFEGHKEGRAPWRMHETVQGREYLLLTRKPMEELHSTPAGRQPYMDFWYNNTWDPQAQYPGTLYGQHGEATVDVGHGTYESSDFHHNGDLQDYYDPFQIHYGKLYGTMDDLRLEHRRVQQKYLAMSNALISSCDVDGFRVDTPMQVPLVFYKAWVPAVKSHAKGLGKKSFGIFGEFYVTPERYSTMTGRGKDHAMYGTDQFIEGPQTMKGGIVYSYYWYMFTAFIYGKPQYADGFGLAYAEEQNMLDTYDEVAGQKRYAMWNFCNNHDNWRMQSMTSTQHLFVCLVIITFWPGIPLHYAGDEQNFRTPGSALDGWAREELSPSLAWQAVRHQDNFLQRDSFDMTSRNYLFIARLNALRSLYFQNFGSSVCDDLKMPQEHLLDVVAFIRGCRQEDEVLVIANFHAKERRRAELFSHWAQGVVLQDSVERTNPWNLTVGAKGHVLMMVPAMNAFVFAPAPLRRLPPIVQSVTPRHGARLTGAMPGALVALQVHFDRPMQPDTARRVALDGQAGLFSCLDESCAKVAAAVPHERWCNGLHSIEVPEGVEDLHGAKMASGFRSSFIVDHHEGIVARPELHERPGLICDRGQKLCHNAAGARWLRIRDVTGNWTQWRPYEAQSEWRAVSGVGVLVQYHAEGSSSYIAGDCLIRTLLRCHSSWHHRMHLRGEFNSWGDEPDWPMRLVDHFTWGANFTADTFLKVKFAPGTGWSQSYGIHPTRKLLYGLPMFDPRSKDFEVEPYRSGAEASRRWMLERGFWSSHESMATSADFAADIWISYLCTPEPPPCPPPAEGEDGWQCHSYRKGENLDWCASVGTVGCVSYALQNFSSEMTSCGQCDCCWRPVVQIPTAEPQTCCILFNDLLLNYTITPDLSRCRAAEVQLAPSWVLTSSSIYEGQTPGRCEDSSAAGSEQEVREVVEDEHDVACASTENDSWITVVATVGWAFLWVVLLLCHSWSRLYLSVVREASPERCRPQARNESHVVVPEEPKRHVLLASIEHHVPERHINAFTGETGAFLQDFIQEHPAGSLSLVHPMLNMDYGHLELYSELAVVVDGKIQTVEVFFLDSQDPIEHDVRWYFLRHELFSDRTQESLFPQPMSKIRALRFYSLWNQALAMLLEALKPDVYHCLDSHQALAPLYMEKQIPMVLLLRDPWTMVSVDSDFIGDRFWKTVSQMRRMSLVFNLKIHTIRRYCVFEGRFNLMSAGVRYISETQRGRGLCVLSVPTARQLRREHRLLQWRPLEALEHPGGRGPDEAEVLDLDALKRQKDQARRALQQHAGLAEADAKVLLFVGPWAHHAGVELLAEVVPQILSRHEQAQVILCGLCSDLSGVMAQDALCRVMPSFRGRLCFLSERYLLPELRGGVDFLLAPFLSEPVGHTDVELGVPTIGCAAGALGRTPGVYFHQQNSLAPEMLKSGFFGALDFALNMPDEDYWNLAEAAHHARSFQAEQWRPDLSQVYDEVQRVFQGRRSDDQEPFDDRLWNNAASQEDLQSAIAPRRSSSLRPVSSTADLAHQMQVLDIDDDAEFLTQPVSESRAQEIMKAVAESLPYFSDHMDAGDLQRDISQARQRLQERNHMTRGLMKPFLRGLCLRIHLVMAICYVTSSVGELLLQTIEVEGEGRAPFGELWLAFYGGASLGGLFWLALSYGVPPNLLMTASQALSLMAFLLLPMLPEHLYEADWSYLSYAAMSGVQSSSKLLFILWNFNEENEHGFQVAIWRLALLEALRRSVSWLALVATYAGKLWIYKQVLFVVSFTSLVLLFKAPYCYATHVLPSTSGALGPSVWFLLLSEICNSLGSYGQDVRNWLALNGWTGEEIQLMILVVIGALPLLLHPSFSWLRRQQVWGPWPLRDFACLLPSGTLLRSVAIFESRGQSRSHTFVAALLFSVLVDAARYAAIASSLMTVMGSRWNALKGCYLASSLIAMAAAMSPWLLQCITEKLGLVSLEDGDADLLELGRSTFWATAPLALLGYVFQASTVFFFEKEVLTFKGPGCWSDGSKAPGLRWLWVAQVRQHMRAAKAKLGQLQERLQAEELDLDQVQAVIEESFAANLPSLLISPKGVGKQIWDTPKNEVLPMQEPEEEEDLPVADEHKGVFSPRDESSPVMNEDKANWEPRGLPAKDALASKSVVSFKTELPPSVEESQEDKDATTTVSIPSFDVTPMAPHDVPPQDEGGGGIDPSAEAEDSDSASSVPAERSSSELQEDSGKGLKLEEEVPSEVLSQEPELASVASLEEEQRSTSLVEEEPETEQTPGVREP